MHYLLRAGLRPEKKERKTQLQNLLILILKVKAMNKLATPSFQDIQICRCNVMPAKAGIS